MKLSELIARCEADIRAKIEQRNAHATKLAELRGAATTDEAAVEAERSAKAGIDAEIDALEARLAEYRAEAERDEAVGRLQAQVTPTDAGQRAGAGGYENQVRVGNEPRTYTREKERSGEAGFASDVAAAFLGGFEAQQRLGRHMQEERAERGRSVERAAGTGAFSGWVVPQYLTDLYAPPARAMRPFADICNHHDLPSVGMVAYIPRITTGSSAGDQANEGDAVSETDMDDTLLSVPVRTYAGAQTISRQGIDRGVGVEEVIMNDLFRAAMTNLDNKLLNTASVGLSAAAAGVTYTDASPTVGELHPKLAQAASTVEGAILDIARPDVALMHSRRWYWLQSQIISGWAAIGTPGIAPQMMGQTEANKYGDGFRGVLPTGLAVVVDNNIVTNAGAGTNEDEVFVVARDECHLWEDPSAPYFLRAEQGKAKNLQLDLVLYGYYAFTFQRYGTGAAAKISGTGLVAPTF